MSIEYNFNYKHIYTSYSGQTSADSNVRIGTWIEEFFSLTRNSNVSSTHVYRKFQL